MLRLGGMVDQSALGQRVLPNLTHGQAAEVPHLLFHSAGGLLEICTLLPWWY